MIYNIYIVVVVIIPLVRPHLDLGTVHDPMVVTPWSLIPVEGCRGSSSRPTGRRPLGVDPQADTLPHDLRHLLQHLERPIRMLNTTGIEPAVGVTADKPPGT